MLYLFKNNIYHALMEYGELDNCLIERG